jgi:5-bromo-4-chloroindolyl phosphate hydrolysis protein
VSERPPPLPARVGGPEQALSDFAQRSRAWAPVAKATALFVLPLPLLAAMIAGLVAGDVERVGLAAGALGSTWTAGVLSWRGLAAEARYMLGERPDLPRVPQKLLGAILTSAGAALAASAAGHALPAAGLSAALGAGGYFAFYGRDMPSRQVSVAEVEGLDTDVVRRELEEAYGRLRRITAASRGIHVREFCDRLDRIIGIGHTILGEIERDPRQASRARRFLHLYLDSTERVTSEYARTHTQVRSASLEQNFRQLLIDMEGSFVEQHQKLLQHDATALDVEIEVLSARLKREGLAEPVRREHERDAEPSRLR